MNRLTKADLYRYGRLEGISGFIKGMFDPGFRYTYFLRKTMRYKLFSVRGLFFRILKRLFTYRGYNISNDAQIGEGLYLYHRGTIYIGPLKIGKNCNIGHNVTIGRAWKNGKIVRPTLGDRVWIGTGAVIVGELTIGSNVLIAPNSYVISNVPDNSLVFGNPSRIMLKENPTEFYIDDILP